MNPNGEQPAINYQALTKLRYQIRRFLRFRVRVGASPTPTASITPTLPDSSF